MATRKKKLVLGRLVDAPAVKAATKTKTSTAFDPAYPMSAELRAMMAPEPPEPVRPTPLQIVREIFDRERGEWEPTRAEYAAMAKVLGGYESADEAEAECVGVDCLRNWAGLDEPDD